MAEYCSYDDVRRRMTQAGVEYVADRDMSGGVSANEKADNITPAIQRASREIDFAICDQIETAAARSQSNGFLKDIAVNLAVVECCTIGGGTPPDSFVIAMEYSRACLKEIRNGRRVPDLLYPSQPSGTQRLDVGRSHPAVVNFNGDGTSSISRSVRSNSRPCR